MALKEIHFKSIDSTSTYAKIHSEDFDPSAITCIYADEQTAGHGRFNRPWVSPKGVNIYATFHFKLPAQNLHLSSLAQVMTTSMAKVLIDEGLSPAIKWPNDIRLNGKKMCGVLCELIFQGDQVTALLGIGVNVNMQRADLEKINQDATSLSEATQKNWDRNSLLKKLQKQFQTDLTQFKQDGFTSFLPLFESLLCHKNQEIKSFDGKKEWVGLYDSINPDGSLNIRLSDRTIHTLYTLFD